MGISKGVQELPDQDLHFPPGQLPAPMGDVILHRSDRGRTGLEHQAAKQLDAQAEAARIIEDGKAQVEVFQRLTEQYQAAGDDGQRIFVLNMLPDLVDKIVSTVNNVDIDRVAVIDTGGGQGPGGIPGFMSQLPAAVVSLSEQIEAATGVDILQSMRDETSEAIAGAVGGSDLPPPPPAPER